MHNDSLDASGPGSEDIKSSHMHHFSRNAARLRPLQRALANGVAKVEINLQHQLGRVLPISLSDAGLYRIGRNGIGLGGWRGEW